VLVRTGNPGVLARRWITYVMRRFRGDADAVIRLQYFVGPYILRADRDRRRREK